MFCSKCGTNVAEGNAFCPNCGAPMTNAQQPTYNAPMAQASSSVPGTGLSIASMVLGIISILTLCIWWLCLILGVLAVSLGAVGIYKAKLVGAKSSLGVAGLVCGCIGIGVMLILYILAYVAAVDFLESFMR